jgi:hypothetical protein
MTPTVRAAVEADATDRLVAIANRRTLSRDLR